jgi:hypothetical protein
MHHRYIGRPDCSYRGTPRRPSAAVERPHDPLAVRPDRAERAHSLTHRTDHRLRLIVRPGAEHVPAARVVRPPKLNVAGQAAGAHRSGLRSVWSTTAAACRLWRILHKRHYVDGRVMWPEAASPLVAESRGFVPAT